MKIPFRAQSARSRWRLAYTSARISLRYGWGYATMFEAHTDRCARWGVSPLAHAAYCLANDRVSPKDLWIPGRVAAAARAKAARRRREGQR